MKNNKGFTLIEILAVIIILGILMVIAVPAVTEQISGSRKSSYITTAKKFIDATLDEITDMEYSVSSEDYTYYIPTECLKAQNGEKSAYGNFLDSYVVVTYKDGKNYFYYTGVDDTQHGILLTYRDELEEDSIKSDLAAISTRVGVGTRNKIYVYSKQCNGKRTEYSATTHIDEFGSLQ